MNKYEKIDIAGEGAYGVVLKCKHKESGELVAIKKFKEQAEEDEAYRKVTLREVKLLKALKHENIVDLKEAFRRKGTLYLVFELMETSVIDVLEANPTGLEKEVVRTMIYQLLRALEHCHKHNVVHRDIKPENLLVNSADNALRLCDFGCARQLKPDLQLTDYVATRWYRPPELLLGSTGYGKGVDIWATGCIMGELTTGMPLFPGKSEIDQLSVIQQVMGALSAQQMQLRMEKSSFKGVEFPEYPNPETLQKRYTSVMPEPQMQVLCNLVVMDEAKRLSAKAALRSKWFEGIQPPPSLRPAVSGSAVAGSAAPARDKIPATSSTRSAEAKRDKPGSPETPTQAISRGAKEPEPYRFDFGRHRGKTLQEAIAKQPSYLRQLVASGVHEEKPELKAALEQHGMLEELSAEAGERLGSGASASLPKSSKGSASPPPVGRLPKSDHIPQAASLAALPAIGAPGQGKGAAAAAAFAVRTNTDSDDPSPFPPALPMHDTERSGQQMKPGKKKRSSPTRDDSPLPDSLTSFQRSSVSNPYVLPWETAKVPEEIALAEYTRTPTPMFGSGTLSGTFGRIGSERSTGKKGAAEGTKAALGSVARWQTIGMRESRWSGF